MTPLSEICRLPRDRLSISGVNSRYRRSTNWKRRSTGNAGSPFRAGVSAAALDLVDAGDRGAQPRSLAEQAAGMFGWKLTFDHTIHRGRTEVHSGSAAVPARQQVSPRYILAANSADLSARQVGSSQYITVPRQLVNPAALPSSR